MARQATSNCLDVLIWRETSAASELQHAAMDDLQSEPQAWCNHPVARHLLFGRDDLIAQLHITVYNLSEAIIVETDHDRYGYRVRVSL